MSLRIIRKLALPSILATFGLGACASGPVFIPITAHKAGSVASQSLHVTNESGWEIQLAFLVPKGRDWNDNKIENVVDSISGGASTPLQSHKGIRLHLTITQHIDGKYVLIRDKLITEEPMIASGAGAIWMHIDGIRLLPGEYVVKIQTLDDDPRINDVNVALSVGTHWK